MPTFEADCANKLLNPPAASGEWNVMSVDIPNHDDPEPKECVLELLESGSTAVEEEGVEEDECAFRVKSTWFGGVAPTAIKDMKRNSEERNLSRLTSMEETEEMERSAMELFEELSLTLFEDGEFDEGLLGFGKNGEEDIHIRDSVVSRISAISRSTRSALSVSLTIIFQGKYVGESGEMINEDTYQQHVTFPSCPLQEEHRS